MTFEDFRFSLDMANEGFKEDFKNDMYLASYNAWQINETVKSLLGNTTALPFNKYIKSLGIYEDEPNENNNKLQKELEKQLALENAKNIVALHRRGQPKKC